MASIAPRSRADFYVVAKSRIGGKLDGQELLIMKESDIMGVLTDLPVAKKKAA
jgi:hypothetical protein